jgi:hypothetical protein
MQFAQHHTFPYTHNMASEPSRPLLLPQNRKIRHVQGIYIRNLTFTRPRGETIDDAGLNKSPGKLEALREPQLHHAHSSSDLRQAKGPRRVSAAWVGQSPAFRQKKLEDVVESRMADTFFTLHCRGQQDPIYISEVATRVMNPSFRFFDLSGLGPAITRLGTLTIKVWVKRQDYILLIEQEVELKTLQFVAKLQNQPLPKNCIIFHLTDGMYTLDVSSKPPPPKPAPSLPTSSYSALMRLSNLDESIQDALATREELASHINSILESRPVDKSPQAQEAAACAARYVTASRKLLKQSVRRRTELQTSIAARKAAMKTGREIQIRAQEDIDSAQEKLRNCRELQEVVTSSIHGQRRRICEELSAIFPIEATEHPLLFTICGLPLPNTSYEDRDEDTISAALGYVARVVDMLQYYLAVPLPYPIEPFGSRSIIRDPISILADNQREFPLYMRGTVRFRFDYGVFLLNKDIERLAESQNLKVIDIRQTLPNLKYLLYVCGEGKGELPPRKAGGIRGLLAGRKTPSLSRRGSSESGSISGGVGDVARRALEGATSAGRDGAGSGSGQENGGGGGSLGNGGAGGLVTTLPFRDETPLSLRTRGLRESVGRNT